MQVRHIYVHYNTITNLPIRYNMPVTIFLLNNNGIYSGIEEIEDVNNIPATGFVPKAHYEKVCDIYNLLKLNHERELNSRLDVV